MDNFVIGIDIGGTNTSMAAVSQEGICTNKRTIRTDSYNELDAFISDIFSEINSILSKEFSKNLIGIGIGAPNGNFFKGTIEYAPNLKWKGVIPLADIIKNKFNIPVLLTNDANAAALGEKIYGGAKDLNDFIIITLGTGLGSGFFVNGHMLYGHDGFAGELGHTIAIENGRKCGCGRNGCLETYVSAPGITKTALELLKHSKIESSLRNIPSNELTSKHIYEAALNFDPAALKAFEFTSRLLGKKLADVVAITSPEAIFLFGGLAQAGDLIIKSSKIFMEESMLKIFRDKVQILPSELPENHAAILGASALIWDLLGDKK